MVESMSMPKWRNFAAWSAAGAIFYTITVWSFSALLHKDSMSAIFRSTQILTVTGAVISRFSGLRPANGSRWTVPTGPCKELFTVRRAFWKTA